MITISRAIPRYIIDSERKISKRCICWAYPNGRNRDDPILLLITIGEIRTMILSNLGDIFTIYVFSSVYVDSYHFPFSFLIFAISSGTTLNRSPSRP